MDRKDSISHERPSSANQAAPDERHAGMATPGQTEMGSDRPTTRIPKMALPALFVLMFMAGVNDSSQGPLILRIQAWYGLTYILVSLIFIFGFLGFFIAALINVWVTDRFGFGKLSRLVCYFSLMHQKVHESGLHSHNNLRFTLQTLAFAATTQIIAYSLILWAPPFPVLCLAFTINGVGMGLQDAQANSFIAKMPNSSPKMSMAHAIYGVGALTAPLIATQFAKRTHWSYHYCFSLGVAVIDLVCLVLVFRFKREEYFLSSEPSDLSSSPEEKPKRRDGESVNAIGRDDIELRSIAPAEENVSLMSEIEHTSGSKMKDIFKSPLVQLLAFFALIYVGLEVSIGGWLVAYLETERGGGPNSGYASSGFFGGLTLGRVLVIPLHKVVNENKALLLYAVIAGALQLTVWLIPSLVGNAIASAFIGMFLGPFYPTLMNVTVAVLPQHLAGGAIGWIASVGQAGSAAFPFATGAMANRYGLWVLQPLLLAMVAAMGLIWAVVLFMTRVQLREVRDAQKEHKAKA